ncbi:family 78 glycoside hydrolase catalytic domain [Streptomyces sp. NBRC 109706]|uniref:family 78 glycoside hydrolase catalytic domain n=1 Tax=Streptomyces sp. NBRC 109706 TaxID=1550035 RepID=UPI000783064C|nr:family 78 glycoside hydrolase catalytic domain [Streptomyces sp. NBRC 109706]
MNVVLGGLTVEHTAEPVGVDVVPRFGWLVTDPDENPVTPTAYRLVVSDRDGVRWDTGRVTSDRTTEVEYSGPPLASLRRHRWSVTAWAGGRRLTAASEFVTGVLDGDWRGARWLAGSDEAAPLLRHVFELPFAPVEAHLVVAAGGYARVLLDGEPVEPSLLSPGFTDYDVRVQYVVTDVTARLGAGRHTLGVELGRGFYGMARRNTWDWHTAPWHGAPRLRLLLLARDASGGEHTVVSSRSWRTVGGPTRADDLYAGEDFDVRHDQPGFAGVGFVEDAAWRPARVVAGPRGQLVNQRQPPIGVTDVLAPESVAELGPGHWVFSFPRVLAGWTRLELPADPERGPTTVELSHGELLRPDGTVRAEDDRGYYDGRFQTHRVTVDRRALNWRPRFSYQGFQHVEVRAPGLGAPPVLTAEAAHTLVRRTGQFVCSDPLLNRLHELTCRTVLNNLHHLPTDTPAYEKNGWTGDGMLGTELFLLNFDAHELVAKWLTDVADSRHGSGAPAVIAPFGGWRMDWSPAPTWHSALVLGPWWLHRYTGDRRIVHELWDDMTSYVEFELARRVEGLADTTLGDWVSPDTDPEGGNPPEDRRIAATAFLHAMTLALASMAPVADRPAEAGRWWREAARVRTAFRRAFVVAEPSDPEAPVVAGQGDTGFRQSHHVLALALRLLPPGTARRAADALAGDIRARGGHLATGALATKFLLPVLTEYGYLQLAHDVATRTTYPSWGYWVTRGATTLWEHWREESRSRGHYFLGTLDDWLFHTLAGLRPTEPGWGRAAHAEPRLPDGVDWVRASVRTPYGLLHSTTHRPPPTDSRPT